MYYITYLIAKNIFVAVTCLSEFEFVVCRSTRISPLVFIKFLQLVDRYIGLFSLCKRTPLIERMYVMKQYKIASLRIELNKGRWVEGSEKSSVRGAAMPTLYRLWADAVLMRASAPFDTTFTRQTFFHLTPTHENKKVCLFSQPPYYPL